MQSCGVCSCGTDDQRRRGRISCEGGWGGSGGGHPIIGSECGVPLSQGITRFIAPIPVSPKPPSRPPPSCSKPSFLVPPWVSPLPLKENHIHPYCRHQCKHSTYSCRVLSAAVNVVTREGKYLRILRQPCPKQTWHPETKLAIVGGSV